MSKTLLEEISAVEAAGKSSLIAQFLYDMCDDSLHPWGQEKLLRDKFFALGKLYGYTLRESFLCYGRGERGSFHKKTEPETEIAAQLLGNAAFGAFAEKIAAYAQEFAFDGGAEDLERLKESVCLVLELNGILSDVVSSYDEKYRQPERDRSNYYALASLLLHLHRPNAFFPFGKEVRVGGIHFRNTDGCRLGEAAIAGTDKQEIAAGFCEALRVLGETCREERLFSPKRSYIEAAALEYSLCCYLARHEVPCELRSPLALSALLVARLKRIRPRAEIEAIANAVRDLPPEEARLHCHDDVEFGEVMAVIASSDQA